MSERNLKLEEIKRSISKRIRDLEYLTIPDKVLAYFYTVLILLFLSYLTVKYFTR